MPLELTSVAKVETKTNRGGDPFRLLGAKKFRNNCQELTSLESEMKKALNLRYLQYCSSQPKAGAGGGDFIRGVGLAR